MYYTCSVPYGSGTRTNNFTKNSTQHDAKKWDVNCLLHNRRPGTTFMVMQTFLVIVSTYLFVSVTLYFIWRLAFFLIAIFLGP